MGLREREGDMVRQNSRLTAYAGRARRGAVAGIVAAGLLLLASCSSEPPITAPPTTTSTSATRSLPPTSPTSPTSSVATTSSPVSTSAAPTVFSNTPAGAEAFVAYYLAEFNKGARIPDAALVAALGTQSCKGCQIAVEMLTRFERQGKRAMSDVLLTQSIHWDSSPSGSSIVIAAVRQPKQDLLNAAGKKIDQMSEAQYRLLFTLTFTDVWRVSKLELIKNG